MANAFANTQTDTKCRHLGIFYHLSHTTTSTMMVKQGLFLCSNLETLDPAIYSIRIYSLTNLLMLDRKAVPAHSESEHTILWSIAGGF